MLSVATARSFKKTAEFLEGMHLKAPLILLDGAMVVTPQKELIDIKRLDKDIVDAIIEEGKKFDIEPFIISLIDKKTLLEEFALPPKMNSYQSSLINKSYLDDLRVEHKKIIRGGENTLKIVYMGDKETLGALTKRLKEVFNNTIETKLAPEGYMHCWFLTILHPLGDKAHALEIVSEYLDIPLSNTTVFGDGINDIAMFKLAGTSVAVSNALEEVKKEASIILPHSNDDDGVAHYLNGLNF
jgi:Cof subfamily protein (haloacid dehalogenase superfamily)